MTNEPQRTNLGKIVPTPVPKQDKHAILDIVAVDGRAYISRKNDNVAPVTDTTAWLKITENTYDTAVRLGLYTGSEANFVMAVVNAQYAASNAISSSVAARSAARAAEDAAASVNSAWTHIFGALLALDQIVGVGQSEILNMQAIQQLIVADAQLSPSRIEVTAPRQITIANKIPQRIEAKVFPAYLVNNVIYQIPTGGGDSIDVLPDGTIILLGVGKSRVRVIAANNTNLYQTVEVEVKAPVARLTSSGKVRLTSNGGIRIV